MEAGLVALETGGMPAVAVEPLAKQLGATKGSFYWHFKDRADLVDAVVELWEQRYVTDAIARFPESRPPSSARSAVHRRCHVSDRANRRALTDAAKTNPRIADTVRRVQERRVEFLAVIYEQLDLPAHHARQPAILALLAQVGMAVVAETAPTLVSTGNDLDTLRSLLTPPT